MENLEVPQKNKIKWKGVTVGGVSCRLTLDSRHVHSAAVQPVAIVFQQNGKRYFHLLPYSFSASEFNRIARSTGRTRTGQAGDGKSKAEEDYKIKTDLESLFETTIKNLTRHFAGRSASIEEIKQILAGSSRHTKDLVKTNNLISLWKEVIDNKDLSLNTRESYRSAMNSFVRYFGGDRLGFLLTAEEINAWLNDINLRAKAGRKTSSGIYGRSLRVVLNEAVRRGLLHIEDYPFNKGQVKISKGRSRKVQYLNVEQMTELYRCFIDNAYPDSLSNSEKESARMGLGIFLAMYLMNGCNMADLARLRYNDIFFNSQGKALSFVRHKTANRNDWEQDVTIPIIPELAKLLEQIAAKPSKDELVFPQILKNAKTEEEIVKRIAQENKNVRERVKKLTSAWGWTVHPGGAWCRHSYATNLLHAGAPKEYVDESMGHAVAFTDITELYMAKYPLEKQFEFNSKLLNMNKEKLDNEQKSITLAEFEEYQRLKEMFDKENSSL